MWPATQRGAAIAEEKGKSWEPGVLSVARIVPVIPIGPDSLAGALEVLIDLVADANNPDRGQVRFRLRGLMTPLILRWHRTFVRRGVGLRASGRTA